MRGLNTGESLIGPEDDAEELRRQVHPAMFDKGVIMKSAFDDNENWMSTLRETVTAEEAYRRWTEDQGYLSIGTYAVEVGNARAQGLPCVDDGEYLDVKDHASVVFEDVESTATRRRISKKLRDLATERGPLYTPPVD